MNSRRSFLKGILAAGVAPYLDGCLSRRGEAVSFAMFNDVHKHLDYFAKLSAHGGGACDFAVFAGHVHMGSFDMPTDERPYPVIVGGGSRVDPVYPTEPLLTRCDIGCGEFVVRQFALDGAVRRERRFTI